MACSKRSLNGREAYISHSEAAALTREDQCGATPGQMSLGREGLRDRAECSGVTAVGATNASASSRRASAPGSLRHYLAHRPEAAYRDPSAAVTESTPESEAWSAAAM